MNIKKEFQFIFFILMTIFFHCASHRYLISEPINNSLKDYTILEVPLLTSNVSIAKEEKFLESIQFQIVYEIVKYNEEHSNNPLFTAVIRSTEKTEDVLIMQGKVLSYEIGSRIQRYIVSDGAGKGFCTVLVNFIDKATGESIGKVSFDSELSFGFFGGSMSEVEKGVAKAIVKFLKNNM